MELDFVDAHQAVKMVADGGAVIIDVREPDELAVEGVLGAVNYPLSEFDPQLLLKNHPDDNLVFLCKMGKRAANACAALLEADGDAEACVISGGIEGWKDLGLPVIS